MTDADRLTRCYALLARKRAERGLRTCAAELAEALGECCEPCHGTGRMPVDLASDGTVVLYQMSLCPACRGSGRAEEGAS